MRPPLGCAAALTTVTAQIKRIRIDLMAFSSSAHTQNGSGYDKRREVPDFDSQLRGQCRHLTELPSHRTSKWNADSVGGGGVPLINICHPHAPAHGVCVEQHIHSEHRIN